ncbi:MAG: hypothetical protein J6031_06095 [Bacteroidales bacterium]|nr:hypothetical protein [Bacteroidales bacterium]
MKKTAFLFVLGSLLMTSCLKDGFKDFEALQHGMTISGTVSPVLGVPIGEGSATIYDMLKMVQISYATMEVDSRGIITLAYDTNMQWHVDLQDGKGSGPNPKDNEIVYVSRNSISGNVAIDLFNNMQILNEADIEVDSLLVYLRTYIKAQANPNTLQAMETYHVHVYYDQLTISVVGQDNVVYPVYPAPGTASDSIPIDNLVAGEYITIFNNTDISSAINKRPKEIQYSARMNIAFEAAFFATAGISENQFVADSIGMQSVDIDGDIKVKFPVSAYLNNLNYQTDISFTPSFHLNDLVVDSSMLYLDCQNGLPLSLLIRAQFVDENDQVLCDILNPVQTEVTGADVALNPETNLYTATTPKQTLIEIPVTRDVFEDLLETRKIRISAEMSTSPTNDPVRNRVSIQATDRLQLRVWAKLRPTYNLNFELGSNGNEEGGEK